jgi:hypothetical protein
MADGIPITPLRTQCRAAKSERCVGIVRRKRSSHSSRELLCSAAFLQLCFQRETKWLSPLCAEAKVPRD